MVIVVLPKINTPHVARDIHNNHTFCILMRMPYKKVPPNLNNKAVTDERYKVVYLWDFNVLSINFKANMPW